MLSGLKGCGKSTLINHFLFSIFDAANYDKSEFKISDSSLLLNQLKNHALTYQPDYLLKEKKLITNLENTEKIKN